MVLQNTKYQNWRSPTEQMYMKVAIYIKSSEEE